MTTPHVLLYVDVNKTLIMHDPTQGKTLHHVINDLLTERALGRVENGSKSWIFDGNQIVADEQFQQMGTNGVSYGTFLRTRFPASGDAKVSNHNKQTRKMLRQTFTAPGNPGELLVTEYETLLEQLLLPRTAATEAQRKAVGLHESPHYFIVPAFFKLMMYLQAQKVSFNLIFRTFGDDLRRVAREFNSFCEGKHPYFSLTKPMDGSDGGIDRRMYVDPMVNKAMPRFGTFLRTNASTMLVMGTFEQPGVVDDSDPLAFYKSQMHSLHVVRGLLDIHDFLARQWRTSQATLALRDFYPHWSAHQEKAAAGKLLTLHPMDVADNVHAMFLDDNILPHDARIVDARMVHDGSAVDFEDSRELHLIRIDPLDVIRCDTYFVDRFETSLQQWRLKQK
ncbi:unnamed protein product [Hyaloperonospora brassicae]|uniref:Uncharacterized protein n=1 Tax=Hyaloperonospora brassicae TaxID=162125 RepID=A0AAV0UF69_HYABA|nr:unnamed protein product [Hyaloperonospora brassicae]